MHPGLLYLILGGIAAVIGMVLLPIGVAQWTRAPSTVVPAGAVISSDKLQADAIKTSQEIIVFITERQRHEPQQSDYSSWDIWTTELIRYSGDTKNMYSEKFGGNVSYLKEQFQKWGLSHPDLDQLCIDPTNYIVMRNGAIALNLLARQLIPQQ